MSKKSNQDAVKSVSIKAPRKSNSLLSGGIGLLTGVFLSTLTYMLFVRSKRINGIIPRSKLLKLRQNYHGSNWIMYSDDIASNNANKVVNSNNYVRNTASFYVTPKKYGIFSFNIKAVAPGFNIDFGVNFVTKNFKQKPGSIEMKNCFSFLSEREDINVRIYDIGNRWVLEIENASELLGYQSDKALFDLLKYVPNSGLDKDKNIIHIHSMDLMTDQQRVALQIEVPDSSEFTEVDNVIEAIANTSSSSKSIDIEKRLKGIPMLKYGST